MSLFELGTEGFLPDAPTLEANVIRPAAEGWRGEWEYVLWFEDQVVLAPGLRPAE